MRKQSTAQVFRITGAAKGLDEDIRGRQRRYVVSMLIRAVAVLAAATLWNVERYVAVVALVLGAVIPYVAVVVANAGREHAPGLPDAFIPKPVRPVLGPGGGSAAAGARARTGEAESAAESGEGDTTTGREGPG